MHMNMSYPYFYHDRIVLSETRYIHKMKFPFDFNVTPIPFQAVYVDGDKATDINIEIAHQANKSGQVFITGIDLVGKKRFTFAVTPKNVLIYGLNRCQAEGYYNRQLIIRETSDLFSIICKIMDKIIKFNS